MTAKVALLPSTGFAPNNEAIARHLEELAAFFRDGEEPLTTVLILVEKKDGSMYRQTVGEVCDLARAVGLLSIATTRAALGD